MFYCEVKFLQYLQPSALLASWLRSTAEPLQSRVIGAEEEVTSQQILAEVLQEENYS